MVRFPNCKINLGLNIIRKRADGFHDIETVFYPLPFTDVLEVIRQPQPAATALTFTASGLPVAGPQESNLCIKAYHLLQKDFPQLPQIAMHLHKVIPMGAGLGGGSADGAYTLQLLNDLFQLGIDEPQLIDYALQLGSDCPFFVWNRPCFATSRGEKMQEVELDLSGYKILIVNPGIHVPTGWAFGQLLPQKPATSLLEIIQQPVASWKKDMINDFEAPVFTAYPEIAAIKQQLYDCGASFAAMTGTGSTVFGLFENEIPKIDFPAHYFVKAL